MSRPPKETEADFLSRWSRRKQDARAEPDPAPEPPACAPPPRDDGRTEVEILEELGLPDPDTLGPGSDFKAFMAEAVPDWLRRRALRRLWRSNPALANLDMLVDYGDDYTDEATVVANLRSAYKAGRGYLDRVTEEKPAAAVETPDAGLVDSVPQAEGAAEEHAAEASVPQDASDPARARAETAQSASAPETLEPGAPEPEIADNSRTAGRAPTAGRRRRMRFDFDQG